MREYIRLWTCHGTWVQESHSVEWRLWNGLICFLMLAHRRSLLGYYMGQVWRFCKPQVNEVKARFDLCTSFRQGNRSVDEWYNAVQAQVSLAKYPTETASILHRDILCFLKNEDFVSKTINKCSVDLQKFPASKVRQLAKKMETSKATAHHKKQVASDP